MLRDSVVVVVVVVVVRTRPRAIPLAMIAIRKSLHGFPFPSRDAYGALLGGPSGRRSSAINTQSTRKVRRKNVIIKDDVLPNSQSYKIGFSVRII